MLVIAIWAFCYVFNMLPATPLTKTIINVVGLILIFLCALWPELGGHTLSLK